MLVQPGVAPRGEPMQVVVDAIAREMALADQTLSWQNQASRPR
jgi:hypothetical protein